MKYDIIKFFCLFVGAAFASVLNLVSGRTQPMDLTRVRTQSGRTYYSFLSIGWGFLADCDIESERLRFLGEPRFALWAVVRVVNLRHYRGRLHFKPGLNALIIKSQTQIQLKN